MWFYKLAALCLLIAAGCGDNGVPDTGSEPTDLDDSTSDTGARITGRVLPPKIQPLVIVLRIAKAVEDPPPRKPILTRLKSLFGSQA